MCQLWLAGSDLRDWCNLDLEYFKNPTNHTCSMVKPEWLDECRKHMRGELSEERTGLNSETLLRLYLSNLDDEK